MKKYSLVFLFDISTGSVLLIEKNKPEWQKGLINGIGGKYEESDGTLVKCAIRELKEEADLNLVESDLALVCNMGDVSDTWCVGVFTGRYEPSRMGFYKSMTDEKINLYLKDSLVDNIIPNLEWLIPMSYNVLMENEKLQAKITY